MFYTVVRQHMQGAVGPIYNHFTANLLMNLSVKEFWKSIKFWQNYSYEFGV